MTGRRVAIVGEAAERAEALCRVAGLLGHDAQLADALLEPDVTSAEVVVVGRGGGDDAALWTVATFGRAHRTAIVAAMARLDPTYAAAAAGRGAHAIVVGVAPAELAAAIAIAWSRFSEYRRLLDAFDRRAEIEQAKGILMARHAISSERAFELLRKHSQRSNHKVVEIARAISQSHTLLVSATETAAQVPHPTAAEQPHV